MGKDAMPSNECYTNEAAAWNEKVKVRGKTEIDA
jgi:hypothetical protein